MVACVALLLCGPANAAENITVRTNDSWSLTGVPKRLGTSRMKRSNNTYGSHYFLSFSAIPLKKHTGFYKNTMVSLNTVAYGLTENFAVAG